MSTSIKIDRRDIIFSYIAQFLSMGVGVITLPLLLNKLSTDEIGLNYILITIGSIVALVDLGFAPQFARNFTYVFSGVQELKKEGVGSAGKGINYELLKYLLKTARCIYGVLAIFAFILLLAIGTPYIYYTTDGFTAVPRSLYIWVIYSIGILFQVYYSYYYSMLLGAGLIKEQKYAVIGNKILYMVLLISGLFLGWGLISVSVAQLVSPFFGRVVSHHFFYSREIKNQLSLYTTNERRRIYEIFKILWYNAKRTAIMSIGAYAILKFSMFIAGLYLSLGEFASYGLMIQLVSLLGIVSCTLIQTLQPKFASLIASGNTNRLLSLFSECLIVYYCLFILGSLILTFWGQSILEVIKSNAYLPSKLTVAFYCIVMLLEYNHSNFAILISSDNKVPFAPASIITGIAVCIGIFLVIKFTNWGIIGFVIVQGLCQLVYQNWKWPCMALESYKLSFWNLIGYGFKELRFKIRNFAYHG